MKTYISILIVLITFLSCKAQQFQTVDISTFHTVSDRTGKHFKDIDNDFMPFVGTWESTTGNITFRLELYTVQQYFPNNPVGYKLDMLRGKFFIIENANTFGIMPNVICESHKQGFTDFDSAIWAGSSNGINMTGTVYDNCATPSTMRRHLEMDIIDPNASILTATWSVFAKGMHIGGIHSFPTDTILTKVN